MRRRDFLKAGGAGILAMLGFHELLKDKKTEDIFIRMNPEKALDHSDIGQLDKKMLEDFLVQLSTVQEPAYTLQDLEENIIILKKGENAFNATLINNDGYFFTANHFPYPYVGFDGFHAVTTPGEVHNIERLILVYSIFYYDFLIGKIPALKSLEVKPLIYSPEIRIGQAIQAVPSPAHPYRERISGKIVKPPESIRDKGKLYLSLDAEPGHSGSLIIDPKLKVIGVFQGKFGELPGGKVRGPSYYPYYGLNVECMKELIEYALKIPNA